MTLLTMMQSRLGLAMVALSLVLFASACGDNQPAAVDEPIVVDEGASLTVTEEAAVDADATTGLNETDGVEAVSTTVMTDTVFDTDVITQVEVTTETTAAEIVVEQQVMTDTDVTINRDTASDTDVRVETENIASASSDAVILLTDAAGTAYLGDPIEGRPLFVSNQDTPIVDENFTPVQMSDEMIYGEGVDQGMFGELEQNGMRQATYNGHPLYRYTGAADSDWRTAANELGLFPVTATGDMGEFAE